MSLVVSSAEFVGQPEIEPGDMPCERLLYVVNIPRFFVTHRLPLALAARDAGFEVHVATSDHPIEFVRQIEDAGFPVHRVSFDQHGTALGREARAIRDLAVIYRDLKPQVVHHVGIKAVAYGGLVARALGVPRIVNAVSGLGSVFTANGVSAACLRAVVVPMLRAALAGERSWLIVQNPDDRRRLLDLRIARAPRTVLIRGSGVDLRAFAMHPEESGVPIALFASRPLWSKGIGAFVDAAKVLSGRARFAVATLDEPGNPDAVPQETIRAWSRAGTIEWWGQRADMPEVLRRSHVVCLPTRYGEGVPKILIEAAAAGRPVVATDAPGCREIVRHGSTGFLVPLGDGAQLVDCLAKLIDDAALRVRMGRTARVLVEQGFGLDRVNAATVAIYRSPESNEAMREGRDA